MKKYTVNDVKASAYQFLATYKKVYNDSNKKQQLLKLANIEEEIFIGRCCVSVDLVAEFVAHLLEIDKKKVKSTLLNNTNESLPKINFNRRQGIYYYYLGKRW